MAVMKEFRTPADFWSGMVEPDFEDLLSNPADLRAAFHAAISLFHMHDWVWKSDEARVRAIFNVRKAKAEAADFADALESQYPDFGRVRGVANAAKHLELRPSSVRPVTNAPRHAANTFVQVMGGGGGYGVAGAYGKGEWGYASAPRVVLEGSTDIPFSDVAKAVYQMWETLGAAHGW
ncbi:MAG: hypothetical protein JO141_22025 [Bradyrhizobium sp.]|nr:hypothetical protein [Bradyrhizobium sp.]